MGAIRGERVRLRQRNGGEVELIVSGDENYASYETPDGFPVVYDAPTGMFVHAKLVNGRFEPTNTAADQPPPPGALPHLEESAEARRAKSAAARALRGGS